MINSRRKLHLTKVCRLIFINVPKEIKGTESLAQLVVNRVESVAKTADEFSYMTDVITYAIKETKGKEVEIIDGKGKTITKRDFLAIAKKADLNRPAS